MNPKYLNFILKSLTQERAIKFIEKNQDVITELLNKQMSLLDVIYFCNALNQYYALRTQKPEFIKKIIDNLGVVVKFKVEKISNGDTNYKD